MYNYLTIENNVVTKCDVNATGTIYVPKGVTEIGERAFFGCKNITEIVISDTVTTIGECAFSFCRNLVKCILSDAVINIKSEAFHYCSNLQEINLNNVTKIGDEAFSDCDSLTNVHIPSTTTHIESDAFCRCDKLEAIVVSEDNPAYKDINGVLFRRKNNELMCYPRGKLDTIYTIPKTTNEISYKAFSNVKYLKEVIIPEGIWNLKMWTFYCCRTLETIHLPETMKWIGLYCFSDCPNLKNINIPDAMELIGCGSFQDCAKLCKLNIPEHTFVSLPTYTFRGTKVPHMKPGLYRTFSPGINNIENELSFDWKKVPNMFVD